jgi:hypothetical protein
MVPYNLCWSTNPQDSSNHLSLFRVAHLPVPLLLHYHMAETIFFLGSHDNFLKNYPFVAKPLALDPQLQNTPKNRMNEKKYTNKDFKTNNISCY